VTSQEVWDFLRVMGTPVNALHAQGYVSIGCAPCTRAVLPGQQEREGRWWWEDAADKECGLHSGNLSGVGDAAASEDSSTLFLGNPAITELSQREMQQLLDAASGAPHKTSTLAVLYAPWCQWCQRMQSGYEQAAAALGAKGVRVAKMRADEEPLNAWCKEHLSLETFPTVLLFPAGRTGFVKMSGTRRDADSLQTFVSSIAALPEDPPPSAGPGRGFVVRAMNTEDTNDVDTSASAADPSQANEFVVVDIPNIPEEEPPNNARVDLKAVGKGLAIAGLASTMLLGTPDDADAARTGGRAGGRSFRPAAARVRYSAPQSATRAYRARGAMPVPVPVPVYPAPGLGLYGYYGYGGISPGAAVGLSLAELIAEEQRRSVIMRQQLDTQRQLGQDTAQIQALQTQLAAQEARIAELQAQVQESSK